MPPAVALLNYISCGILWRIFCQIGTFRGVFLHFINFAVRISEAAMGRAEVRRHNMINTRLSRVQRSIEGCDRWGEGREILYFEASVV